MKKHYGLIVGYGQEPGGYIGHYTLTLASRTGECFCAKVSGVGDVVAFVSTIAGCVKYVDVCTGLACRDREVTYALDLLGVIVTDEGE